MSFVMLIRLGQFEFRGDGCIYFEKCWGLSEIERHVSIMATEEQVDTHWSPHKEKRSVWTLQWVVCYIRVRHFENWKPKLKIYLKNFNTNPVSEKHFLCCPKLKSFLLMFSHSTTVNNAHNILINSINNPHAMLCITV